MGAGRIFLRNLSAQYRICCGRFWAPHVVRVRGDLLFQSISRRWPFFFGAYLPLVFGIRMFYAIVRTVIRHVIVRVL